MLFFPSVGFVLSFPCVYVCVSALSDKTPTPVLNPLPGVQLINLCSDHCVSLIPALPPQVVLINAVRDVAKALTELIGATKCAAGKAADDPSMYQLKSAAKVKALIVRPFCFSVISACDTRAMSDGGELGLTQR